MALSRWSHNALPGMRMIPMNHILIFVQQYVTKVIMPFRA